MNEWLIGKIIYDAVNPKGMFYLVIDTCGVSGAIHRSHYLPSSVLSTRGLLSSQTDEKPSLKLGFYVLLKSKVSQHKHCGPWGMGNCCGRPPPVHREYVKQHP